MSNHNTLSNQRKPRNWGLFQTGKFSLHLFNVLIWFLWIFYHPKSLLTIKYLEKVLMFLNYICWGTVNEYESEQSTLQTCINQEYANKVNFCLFMYCSNFELVHTIKKYIKLNIKCILKTCGAHNTDMTKEYSVLNRHNNFC